MTQVQGKTSSRSRAVRAALKNKRAAEERAAALAPTIRKLMAAGFVSQRALAEELNRRGIPTGGGDSWHRTSLGRMLGRLDLITKGRINNGLASKQAADARARALASTVRELQAKSYVSFSSIARELNKREMPTALGGEWHPNSIKRLLPRLKRLGL